MPERGLGVHAGRVAAESSALRQRREQIGERLAAIRLRLEELREVRLGTRTAPGERLESAQRHVTASRSTADEAIAASSRAFRASAEAHERAARQHERSAAAGSGDKDEHLRRAADHRAAAGADMQRAEDVQLRLPQEAQKEREEENDVRGTATSRDLQRLVSTDVSGARFGAAGWHVQT